MDLANFFKDPTMLLMIAVLAVLVFFMIRNSRKRKRDAEEMAKKFVPGVTVMTSFGLYGKVVSIDNVENICMLEISPNSVIKIHRQAIARVVEGAPEVVSAPAKASVSTDAPAFGVRSSSAAKSTTAKTSATKSTGAKSTAKPATKSSGTAKKSS